MELKLVAACRSGDDSLVLSLINSGVNVNCLVRIDGREWSPLMMASGWGHTDIVKLLLERGAQIDLQNYAGQIALMWASIRGHTDIVKVLLERGAQVDFLDNDGSTALMWASGSGHTEIVKLLLEHGAQLDLQNYAGQTALMWASIGEHTEIVKVLLEHGARVDLETNNGYTAMNSASSHEIVDLLLSAMIPQLINLLQPVAHKWKELGEHLGLKETTLNQYYSSAKEDEGRLQAVMNTWSQQNDPRPTWRALIRAVEMVDRVLAQNMNQLVGKY